MMRVCFERDDNGIWHCPESDCEHEDIRLRRIANHYAYRHLSSKKTGRPSPVFGELIK